MDNYKIKVKDEAESKEAQELFFELGFAWLCSKKDITNLDVVFIYAKDGVLTAGFNDHNFAEAGHKELTLPQLRDLVVLKRNDVKDANVEDGTGFPLYLSSTNELYVNDCEWNLSKKNGDLDYICKLKLIHRPQDPALISGVDIPSLIKKGESVQFRSAFNVQGGGDWQDLNLERDEEEFSLGDLINTRFEWRLKPQTIKLELELPKPFEPKDGDEYFYISTLQNCLYSHDVWSDEPADITQAAFGAYRTEDDVKKAVEQLRKIRGANS